VWRGILVVGGVIVVVVIVKGGGGVDERRRVDSKSHVGIQTSGSGIAEL